MENLPSCLNASSIQTKLPDDIIDHIVRGCRESSAPVEVAATRNTTLSVRQAFVKSVSTYEWFAGMLWFYLDKINRMNFRYDITCLEREQMSYIMYHPGQYYHWHVDQSLGASLRPLKLPMSMQTTVDEELYIDHQWTRKISFSLQLTDGNDYEGGDLQLYDGEKVFTASREKGSLLVFDSRLQHRVRKVKSGIRESLVGWALGPKWK